MKKGILQDTQRLLAFLAKAPVDRLIACAKINHFPVNSLVCSRDQLAECAYLVLKGKCELDCWLPEDGVKPVKSFGSGEAFGGSEAFGPDFSRGKVTAMKDSVVLGIRLDDLARLAANGKPTVNGRHGANGNFSKSSASESSGGNTAFFFHGPHGRLILLNCLSPALPAQYLAENMARHLQSETGDAVAVVLLGVDPRAADLQLTGNALLPDEFPHDEAGLPVLRIALAGELQDSFAIGGLFQSLRRRFSQVVVGTRAGEILEPRLIECILHADKSFFLIRRADDDLNRLGSLALELRSQLNSPLKPVLCLGPDEAVNEFEARIAALNLPPPVYIRGCPMLVNPNDQHLHGHPTGTFTTDLRRLARLADNRLVGLALSSGGAKGLVHIGVLQVFEENGIEADLAVGSSMGAYVASIWAYGHNGIKLEELARALEAKRAVWRLMDPVLLPWRGFLRGYAVEKRLRETIGRARFADLARPLYVVAANLDTLERVVFSSGEVADAVHASTAVPGIFVPVRIGGEIYVDGGIVDPLPTDVLVEMGIRKIIAVNAIPSPDHYRLRAGHGPVEHVEQTARKARDLVRQLVEVNVNRPVNSHERANVLEVLMHSTRGAQMRLAEASSRAASIVLHPEICSDRWLDFRNPGQYIQAGREIALRHLDEIKAVLKEKGSMYATQPSKQILAEAA